MATEDFALLVAACKEATLSEDRTGALPLEVALSNRQPLGHIACLLEAQSISPSDLKLMCEKLKNKCDTYSPSDILFLGDALYGSERIVTTHIHICGDSRSGKSTIALALKKTLKRQGAVERHTLPSRSSWTPLESTVGMRCYSVQYSDKRFTIHDYGGQHEFHVNHSSFLSAPGSIYIIVVPICDVDSDKINKFRKPADIALKYRYWLNYVNSVADKRNKSVCITVLNTCAEYWPSQSWPDWLLSFGGVSSTTESRMVIAGFVKCLNDIRSHWIDDIGASSVLIFPPEIVEADTNIPNDVRDKVNDVILKAINSAVEMDSQITKLCKCVKNILSVKSDWPAVLTSDEFRRHTLSAMQFVDTSGDDLVEEDYASSHVEMSSDEKLISDYLVPVIKRRLEAMGEILTITSGDENDLKLSHVITNLNWLTETVLGRIAVNLTEMRKCANNTDNVNSDNYYFMSHDDLRFMVNNMAGSCKFENNTITSEITSTDVSFLKNESFLSILPRLIVSIGACINVKIIVGSSDVPEDRLWFPVNYFADNTTDHFHVKGTEFIPVDISVGCQPKNNRVIVRRYKLHHNQCAIFAPGYFLKLFSDINTLMLASKNIVQLKDYAMKIKVFRSQFNGASFDVQIIISRDFHDNGRYKDSFVLIISTTAVTVPAILSKPISPPESYAVFLLKKINAILLTSFDEMSIVSDDKNIRNLSNVNISKQSWIHNTELDEFCLHPIREDSKYTMETAVLEAKLTLMNCNSSSRDRQIACELYYGVCGVIDETNKFIFDDICASIIKCETRLLSEFTKF